MRNLSCTPHVPLCVLFICSVFRLSAYTFLFSPSLFLTNWLCNYLLRPEYHIHLVGESVILAASGMLYPVLCKFQNSVFEEHLFKCRMLSSVFPLQWQDCTAAMFHAASENNLPREERLYFHSVFRVSHLKEVWLEDFFNRSIDSKGIYIPRTLWHAIGDTILSIESIIAAFHQHHQFQICLWINFR